MSLQRMATEKVYSASRWKLSGVIHRWGSYNECREVVYVMVIPAKILQRAMELYLQQAYPEGTPVEVVARLWDIRALKEAENVPLDLLEPEDANGVTTFVLRLGQPMYPFMKLVFDPVPHGHAKEGECHPPTPEVSGSGTDFILRVDAHDRHLHAAPGSPDAAWLASVRASNKELGERIEAAWCAAGLPTFKTYLRGQLEQRKRAKG